MLGNGWYRGNLGWERQARTSTATASACCCRSRHLHGRARGDHRDRREWKAATGPILMSEIYDGETYDARLEKAGWTAPGFDDRPVGGRDGRRRTARTTWSPPPGRRCGAIEELKPVKILKTPAGDTVVDMGQNMVGWVRLKVAGPAGHDRHAAPRRGARQGRQLLHREPARGEADGHATR